MNKVFMEFFSYINRDTDSSSCVHLFIFHVLSPKYIMIKTLTAPICIPKAHVLPFRSFLTVTENPGAENVPILNYCIRVSAPPCRARIIGISCLASRKMNNRCSYDSRGTNSNSQRGLVP